jgi:DNA-binding XRE family transcriptional regulator
MGKKITSGKSVNKIKKVAKELGASSRLLSLWVDVDYTTVSNWSSNKYQPNDDNLNQIGELLEKDNRDLLESQGRISSGLAKALEQELKRLHKVEGLPYEVEKFDKKKGVNVKVNNLELVKRLREFAEKYKK